MAIIYPKIREKISASYAEQKVYEALCGLSNDFIVFHSVNWVKKNFSRSFTWYENDFLLLNRKYGLLVLEVKGGIISCVDGLIHQENTATHRVSILNEGNDPLSQAIRGKYHFRNQIANRIGNHIKDRLLIEPLIWFPTCIVDKSTNLPSNYKAASFAVFDESALSENSSFSLEDRIINVFRNYHSNQIMNITDSEFDEIQNILAPDFQLVPSPSMIKGELDHAFLKLTTEQSGLLDYIQEQNQATIQGVAGTGKTLIAIEAAKRFADKGRKVLFLCFNKFLFHHLKNDLPYQNVTYFNINSYIRTLSGIDAARADQRIVILQRFGLRYFEYDDVIIDEAQDFENEEILYFKEACKKKSGHFLVFYDKNQLLTTERVPEWITESECKLILTRNCRNTYEIACTSYNVIDIELNQSINMIHGKQTSVIFTENDTLKKMKQLLDYYTSNQYGYANREITILSMKALSDSLMHNVKKIDNYHIVNDTDNRNITFTTAKKFKGLENKVVIVIDIDEKCFFDENTKRTFYVACSRATHNLTLMIDGDAEKIDKIARLIPISKLSSKGKISVKTKSIPLSL